jgi:hypothetical protein
MVWPSTNRGLMGMMGCNRDVIGIYNQLKMLYKARVIYALCA